MRKILVFDMDGTIADLYGCEGWLDDIINCNARPYKKAKPLFDMFTLTEMLKVLKNYGWEIAITSWLAKNSNEDYDKKVTSAKIEWLKKYDFPCDIINIVKYGTVKTTVTEKLGGYQILFDDEEPNRMAWNLGKAINPQTEMLETLVDLIAKEIGY